jgi:hypothetical protein
MLRPTTPRLLMLDAVPYFLWDLGLSVSELRRQLAGEDPPRPEASRDDLIARILREANSRDVWLFLDWPAIEDAWPRIQHRLGRARGVWQMMLDRHRDHGTHVAAA